MRTSAMAPVQEVHGGVEWQVTVPEGSVATIGLEPSWIDRAQTWLVSFLLPMKSTLNNFGRKTWRIGADDPRKAVHGVKVGMALTLVSLFYYTRPLYNGVGGCAMWAVMTIVVVFEFTVGGCLYKGVNRAIATSTAGLLAIGIHWIASKSGAKAEPVISGASVFILASAATFSRFIPTIRAQFDYGVTIFILTFSLVAVSGYRVEELLHLAQQRICTIGIGVIMSLLVCILVCPVWAGQELHLLICSNIEKLAESFEGLVKEYFMEEEKTKDVKEPPSSTRSQGYKCVLNSKASEESLVNLARWEPAHGCYGFRHPWIQYLRVGAALRYCACCMEALNGCFNSDIPAPESMKKHLNDVCLRLGFASSKVLKELANSIKLMEESQSIQSLVAEMNNAVQELQVALRTLSKQLTQPGPGAREDATGTIKKQAIPRVTVSLMEAMPLITATSLLIEVSERIEPLVDAVTTLACLAGFESINQKKVSSSVVPQEDEADLPEQV